MESSTFKGSAKAEYDSSGPAESGLGMTPSEYLSQKGWEYKHRSGGWLELKYCPFCDGGSHRDVKTFAVNNTEGNYVCQRGKCGVSGSFKQLQEHFGDAPVRTYTPKPRFAVKQSYKPPATRTVDPDGPAKDYLALRGFTEKSIVKRQVSIDERGNIVLPYFENGEKVMLKFRHARKTKQGERKAWREEGGKPVLWGLDLAEPSKGPLVITFGEYDTMTLDECDIPNAVSVPSGDKDLTWIDLDWERLQRFSEIILWPDNDEPDANGERSGEIALKACAVRLDIARVRVVSCQFKDANEMLYRVTKQFNRGFAEAAIQEVVSDAGFYPVEHIIRVVDIPDEPVVQDGTTTGWRGLDRLTGGHRGGEVTAWAGDNSSGKTSAMLTVAAEAINQNEPVFIYSGEMRKSKVRYWSELVMAGPELLIARFSERTGRDYFEVDQRKLPLIRDWYANSYYLYDVLGGTTEDTLFDTASMAARRFGCTSFIFDNLMMLTIDATEKNYLSRQASFVGRCKEFAEKYNVHIHLITHNRKPTDSAPRPTKGSVEGTQKITNLVDNVLTWYRIPEQQKRDDLEGVDSLLYVFKIRDSGEPAVLRFNFDRSSKRLYECEHPENRIKMYGWAQKPIPMALYGSAG